jgi:hypothetical protein
MSNWLEGIILILGVFVIPSIIYASDHRSKIGSICGYIVAAEPGLVFAYALVKSITLYASVG